MVRPWHWLALVLPCYLGTGCGGPEDLDPLENRCEGLKIAVLETAVAPPANVAALVRATDCDGDALGFRLSAAHFELTEDGRAVSGWEGDYEILLAERQMAPKTVVLLDLSGSIVRANLRDPMVDGAASLVARLPADQQIAVFGFDGRPELVRFSGFTDDREALADALERARKAEVVDDSTNLYGAISGALQLLDIAVDGERRDLDVVAHGALVLFTDGDDRAARVSWDVVDRELDDTEHSTFAIGVGPSIDDEVLAGLGRTSAMHVEAGEEILAAFEKVGDHLRAIAESQYVVSHCSPARAGLHELTVAVKADNRVGRATIPFDASGFGGGCRPEDAPVW